MGRAWEDVAQENQGKELRRECFGSPGPLCCVDSPPDLASTSFQPAGQAFHPPPGRETSHRWSSCPLRLRTVLTLGGRFLAPPEGLGGEAERALGLISLAGNLGVGIRQAPAGQDSVASFVASLLHWKGITHLLSVLVR